MASGTLPPARSAASSTLAKRAGPDSLFLELTSPLDITGVDYVEVGGEARGDVVAIVSTPGHAVNLVLKDRLTRVWPAKTIVVPWSGT